MEEEPVTQERGVGGGGLLLRLLLLLLLDGERRHGDGGEGGGGLPLACHAAESGDREEEDQGGVDGGDVEGEKSFADAFPCGISYTSLLQRHPHLCFCCKVRNLTRRLPCADGNHLLFGGEDEGSSGGGQGAINQVGHQEESEHKIFVKGAVGAKAAGIDISQ